MFDVAQADGETLPTVDVPTVNSAADDLLADLILVAEQCKIEVTLGPIRCIQAWERGSIERTPHRPATLQA